MRLYWTLLISVKAVLAKTMVFVLMATIGTRASVPQGIEVPTARYQSGPEVSDDLSL